MNIDIRNTYNQLLMTSSAQQNKVQSLQNIQKNLKILSKTH